MTNYNFDRVLFNVLKMNKINNVSVNVVWDNNTSLEGRKQAS